MNEKSISSISKSSQKLEDKVTSLEMKIPEIDAAIEYIKNYTILSLYGSIEAIEEVIARLKHNDTQKQKKISKLKDDFEALKNDFVSFDSTIQQFNYTAQIGNLQNNINILNGDRINMKNDIKALQDKVNDIDIHDSVLETAIRNLQNDTETLENIFEELSAKTSQLELKNDDHEERLNKLDGLITDLKIDLKNFTDRVIQLNYTDQRMETAIGQLEDADFALNVKIKNLEYGFEKLSNRSDFRDDQFKDFIDNLQISINDLNKELSRVEQESDQEDAELRSQIQDAKNNLNNFSDELKALTDGVNANEISISAIQNGLSKYIIYILFDEKHKLIC